MELRNIIQTIIVKENTMRKSLFISIFFIGSIYSCAVYNNSDIIGNWKALVVLEEGEALEIDAGQIQFTFLENESYQYNSTLNYKEAGSFYIDSKFLFTRDTMNQASTEKVVEILKLSKDSLFLKMNENG